MKSRRKGEGCCEEEAACVVRNTPGVLEIECRCVFFIVYTWSTRANIIGMDIQVWYAAAKPALEHVGVRKMYDFTIAVYR